MTPAINALKKAKIDYIIHQYVHDPQHASYGMEAAEKLGVDAERVFKTLMVKLDGKSLAIGIVPVNFQLSMKKIAKALGGKKAHMAEPREVERTSGYILGGISPLGQKKRLKSIIDSSAEKFSTIFVSAGQRGLEIELEPKELSNTISARFAEIAS